MPVLPVLVSVVLRVSGCAGRDDVPGDRRCGLVWRWPRTERNFPNPFSPRVSASTCHPHGAGGVAVLDFPPPAPPPPPGVDRPPSSPGGSGRFSFRASVHGRPRPAGRIDLRENPRPSVEPARRWFLAVVFRFRYPCRRTGTISSSVSAGDNFFVATGFVALVVVVVAIPTIPSRRTHRWRRSGGFFRIPSSGSRVIVGMRSTTKSPAFLFFFIVIIFLSLRRPPGR